MKQLREEHLSNIIGGTYCSIFDIGCWGWGSIKQIGGMIGSSPTPPSTCIPKSASNPVPPVPCP
ncbi:pncT [Streptococcus suis]|uniref:pncT n=1 Tax=Streptococcus suis TaxID=1307 RepID=UPI00376DFDB1